MKTLPPFLNGTIEWQYDGAELHPLTEEHVKFVTENLDAHYLLREEFSNRMKSEIFDPFDIFKHKFGMLVAVAQNLPNLSIRNVSLMLLFEDLCKFIPIALSDITVEPPSPKGERFLFLRYRVVAPQAVKTVIPAAFRTMALL